MRHEFHPEALREFGEAAQYYGRQRAGLELRFIAAVENTIEIILEDPLRWRAFDEDVHRFFTRIFP
jgi:hypothetical protein